MCNAHGLQESCKYRTPLKTRVTPSLADVNTCREFCQLMFAPEAVPGHIKDVTLDSSSFSVDRPASGTRYVLYRTCPIFN